jgi:MFS family permease
MSAVVGFAGISIAHFWTALVLLGVGWNFAFIGATTMVTECYRPEERTRVQAFNDFLIFGTMAFGSFASGGMLAYFGWYLVNLVMLPVIAVAGAMLAWLALRRRPQPA